MKPELSPTNPAPTGPNLEEEHARNVRRLKAGLLVLAAVPLAFCLISGLRGARENAELEAIEQRWGAAAKRLATGLPGEVADAEYLPGPVLPIRADQHHNRPADRRVDAAVFRVLPERLRPADPAKVGAVALLDYRDAETRDYDSGTRQHRIRTRQACRIRVYDLEAGLCVADREVLGDPLPEGKNDQATLWVEPEDVVRVLEALPAR